MSKKRASAYSRHPHVIAEAAQPAVTIETLSRTQFEERYRPLSEAEAPEYSVIQLVRVNGRITEMRVLLPDTPIAQNGMHRNAVP